MPTGNHPPAQSMSAVLQRLVDGTEGDTVRFEQLIHVLGKRAYGPLLMITSLLELLPIISAIPGMYIVVAVIVILFAGQLLFLRPEPWLPARIRRFSLPRRRLVRAVELSLPWARRIDRWIAPRLTLFVRPPFVQLIALICIAMAVLFFPLAFIPASEKILAIPVFVFALALTAEDGLLALLGLAATAATLYLPLAHWSDLLQWARGWWT